MSKRVFDNSTPPSTPKPISSSSMSSVHQRFDKDLDNFPQRDSNGSLGLLKGIEEESEARLQEARALARRGIQEAKNAIHLPSRLLNPKELSASLSEALSFNSQSSISESDLFPTHSSTPRESSFDFKQLKGRRSVGPSLTRLSQSFSRNGGDLGDWIDDVHTAMQCSSSFKSGVLAEEQLKADEMLWHQDQLGTSKEFSMNAKSFSKVSVGEFFKGRSADLPCFKTKSPEKVDPIPLIDNYDKADDQTDAFSVSSIAKLLKDNNTPAKLTDYLMQGPKKSHACLKVSPKPKDSLSIQETEEMKENFNSLNMMASPETPLERSVSSSRSSSALGSLPDGKLPIATTKYEMVWGCVKQGKTETQEFLIKNKSTGRLRLKITLSNPSFKLVKDSECTNLVKLTLHPLESKSLVVAFSPSTVGAACDMLQFVPVDSHHQQTSKQFIKLFGYGGYTNLSINNVITDTSGRLVASLGMFDGSTDCIRKIFNFKNNGSLPLFACLEFVPPGLYTISSMVIKPDTIVLRPGENKDVTITYSVKKEDLNYINKTNLSVVHMGKITMIYGSEVDRGRLRNLCAKYKGHDMDVVRHSKKLIQKFPDEEMPSDLKHMKESNISLKQILQLLTTKDIFLTMEQDLDNTLTGNFRDETSMFHSLCEDSSVLFNNTLKKNICTVEPSGIMLSPPTKTQDFIVLTNRNAAQVPYEVRCSPEGLRFAPSKGVIAAGKVAVITIKYSYNSTAEVFKVKILIGDELFYVDVNVLSLNELSG